MKNQIKYIPTAIIFIIGLTISIFIYGFIKKEETKTKKEYIEKYILERRYAIENEMNINLKILSLFQHDWEYANDEFKQLAISILKTHSDILNVCWVEKVPFNEIDAIKKRLPKAKAADFYIKEINEQGKFIQAAKRSDYYPAIFSLPPYINEQSIVGFDFGSEESSLKAINSAITNQELTLSNFSFFLNEAEVFGLLSILPVFDMKNQSRLKGMVVAQFEINNLLFQTLSKFKEEEIWVNLYDITNPQDKTRIGQYIPKLNTKSHSDFQENSISYSYDLSFANKVWELEFMAAKTIEEDEHAVLYLTIGLITTLLLTVYLLNRARTLEEIRGLSKKLASEIFEKNKVEKILRESETRFRLLYENAPLSYQSMDIHGNIIDVNSSWLETLGYTREEVIGSHFSMIMTEESAALVQSRFEGFKKVGELHKFEFELVRKDKTQLTVSYEGKIGYDEAGNFKQTHCIFQDITQQRKAELALKASEEKYRAFIEGTDDLITQVDVHGNLQFVNHISEQIWGLKAEECIGKSAFEFIHPDDIEFTKREFERWIKDKVAAASFENRSINKMGESHNLLWTIKFYYDDFGSLKEINSIGTNITERKKAESLLRESEEKYRAAFITSPDAISISTLEGVYVDINEGFTKITEYTQDEILGESAREKNIWTRVQDREFLLSELKNKGECNNLEVVFRNKNGKHIVGLMSAKIIHLEGMPHILSMTRDISRQREHEKILLNTIIETQEHERKRFAEDLHDDLGPFLSGIKLYIKELSYKDVDYEQRLSITQYLNEFVNSAIEKTRSISNDLMPNVLTAYGFIAALNSFCSKINHSKEIEVSFHSNIEDVENKTLGLSLYRICIELINNTIKHAKASNIDIRIDKFNEILQLSYSDDGEGFSFEETIQKSKGIGLRSIISRLSSLGADYNFYSKPGNGIHLNIILNLPKFD